MDEKKINEQFKESVIAVLNEYKDGVYDEQQSFDVLNLIYNAMINHEFMKGLRSHERDFLNIIVGQKNKMK